MVNTRGQSKRNNFVYTEESDVSDNESEYSNNTGSTYSESSSSYTSSSSSDYSSSESEQSEVKMTKRWKDDNVGSLVSDKYDSETDNNNSDPDYEYESDEYNSDDSYDSEFEDLMEMHNQLKKWKEKHNITYDDALLIHSLVMIRYSR